jgi:hypothetical protein
MGSNFSDGSVMIIDCMDGNGMQQIQQAGNFDTVSQCLAPAGCPACRWLHTPCPMPLLLAACTLLCCALSCYPAVLLLNCVRPVLSPCDAGRRPRADHCLSAHCSPTCTTDFSALQHVAMMQAMNPNRLNRGSPPLAMTTPPAMGISVRYVNSLSRWPAAVHTWGRC